MQTDHWAQLQGELDGWASAGRSATFWLRDDDAVEPSEPLDQLLNLMNRHAVPGTLAVIPEQTGKPLAHRLAGEPMVAVAVHGWSHRNHAQPGEKKKELGLDRPVAEVVSELGEGFRHLQRLHGDRFMPMLVPPWNRIDEALLPALPGLGYRALSVRGPEKPAPLQVLNTHVDVMDWRGTRGGRDHALLVAEIIGRLRDIDAAGGTVGLLTHHLVHDEIVWAFLDALFASTAAHPGCQWRSAPDILG